MTKLKLADLKVGDVLWSIKLVEESEGRGYGAMEFDRPTLACLVEVNEHYSTWAYGFYKEPDMPDFPENYEKVYDGEGRYIYYDFDTNNITCVYDDEETLNKYFSYTKQDIIEKYYAFASEYEEELDELKERVDNLIQTYAWHKIITDRIMKGWEEESDKGKLH